MYQQHAACRMKYRKLGSACFRNPEPDQVRACIHVEAAPAVLCPRDRCLHDSHPGRCAVVPMSGTRHSRTYANGSCLAFIAMSLGFVFGSGNMAASSSSHRSCVQSSSAPRMPDRCGGGLISPRKRVHCANSDLDEAGCPPTIVYCQISMVRALFADAAVDLSTPACVQGFRSLSARCSLRARNQTSGQM